MKTFVCVILLAACAMAAPASEQAGSKRDKRSGWAADWWPSSASYSLPSYSSYSLPSYSSYSLPSYSLGAPIVSHSVVSAPAVVSVNKVVSVPKVVAVKKIVSVPEVVSVPHVVSSHSYAPSYLSSSYSSGWW